MQYPEERLLVSRRSRGQDFIWDATLCTGCATCAKACPQGEIEIVTKTNGDNAYIVDKIEIDIGRCMFCGLCVESCPYGALFMCRSYEQAKYSRWRLISGKDELAVPGREISAYARPHLEGQIPEQTLLVYQSKGEGRKWKIYRSR